MRPRAVTRAPIEDFAEDSRPGHCPRSPAEVKTKRGQCGCADGRPGRPGSAEWTCWKVFASRTATKTFFFLPYNRGGGERSLAISKERKEELLGEYAELIQKSEGMILVEYRGLNMKGMDPLRTKVRAAAGELHVVKNTLARKALADAGRQAPTELFTTSTAVGFAFSDLPGVAKALTTFAKENEFVKVKGALLGDRLLTAKDVEALAELPPLPVVRAQLLGLLSAPASQLAGVVASGVRQMVNVVKAYSDKDAAAAETPAAA
jgi:large subunit ribosomal protein L10